MVSSKLSDLKTADPKLFKGCVVKGCPQGHTFGRNGGLIAGDGSGLSVVHQWITAKLIWWTPGKV
jgi:hypothetical protein